MSAQSSDNGTFSGDVSKTFTIGSSTQAAIKLASEDPEYQTFTKDPDAILGVQMDWADWAYAADINALEWVVVGTIAKAAHVSSGKTSKVFLAGGVPGASYVVTARARTADGLVGDRSVIVRVMQR